MNFKLRPYHRDTSDEVLIEDLKRVAILLKQDSITIDEYEAYGRFHSSTLRKRFGSWRSASTKAGLKKRTHHGEKISDQDLFQNLEEVWIRLGRQPKYKEIQRPVSKYSIKCYERRFGTWRGALECFVDYVNKPSAAEAEYDEAEDVLSTDADNGTSDRCTHKTKRNVSMRLRFLVMKRDNFKCKLCGRSPATDPQVVLHVDHIIAWSNGGETVLNNLQTLCSKCNLGKGNLGLE